MANRLLRSLAVYCLLGVAVSSQAQEAFPRLAGATAVVGGPVTFVVVPRNAPDRERWISSSLLVVQALLPALMTDSRVLVELVPESRVVRRVLPYQIGRGGEHWRGDYCVSRIATQRTPDGREEHLEVFLRKGTDPEKAYNVSDPFIQTMMRAAFERSCDDPDGFVLTVVIDGNAIVSAAMGEH